MGKSKSGVAWCEGGREGGRPQGDGDGGGRSGCVGSGGYLFGRMGERAGENAACSEDVSAPNSFFFSFFFFWPLASCLIPFSSSRCQKKTTQHPIFGPPLFLPFAIMDLGMSQPMLYDLGIGFSFLCIQARPPHFQNNKHVLRPQPVSPVSLVLDRHCMN